MTPAKRGLVFVLSGPSGVGKTALTRELRAREPAVHYCVTATTRPPRAGEQHGVDYFFYSEPEFLRLKAGGEFLEHARVPPDRGPWYGTPGTQVREALARGQDVFAVVDVQGANSIRARIPGAVLIFLRPPDVATLEQRLRGRATEISAVMQARLHNALAELERAPGFDYQVVNADGQLDEAVAAVADIMQAERALPEPRYAELLPSPLA